MKHRWRERILTAAVIFLFLFQILEGSFGLKLFMPAAAVEEEEILESSSLDQLLVKASLFQAPFLSYLEEQSCQEQQTLPSEKEEETEEDEEIREAQWSDPEDQFDTLEKEAKEAISSSMPVKEALRQVYSMEQLSDFSFLTSSLYKVSGTTKITPEELPVEEMLSQDFSMDLSGEGPKILIFHTHATEDFADTVPGDPSTTIVGVGEQLAVNLRETYGIQVLHDTTIFPYNSSYSMAKDHVSQILSENPSIQVVIDLHRDAPGSEKVTTEINGVTMSKIMFFNGLCQDQDGVPFEGLENPNRFQNLSFSLQMKLLADAYYPGLAKRNFLKGQRYNMHLMPRYLLIEAGDQKNTVEEEKNAMGPLADLLYHILSDN